MMVQGVSGVRLSNVPSAINTAFRQKLGVCHRVSDTEYRTKNRHGQLPPSASSSANYLALHFIEFLRIRHNDTCIWQSGFHFFREGMTSWGFAMVDE